ncbi:MAG: bifunctional heptose 7-phosphate kinase/heptose 1-phosphate adenyltransferase [Planctomyces sp.]|jgi:bifunctional ADP-heptose synthase (sugar kinase/adenylyltransferase)
MKLSRLEELVGRFPSRRIAVFGDFFLDRYMDIDPRLAEKSVETGKTAHQVVQIRNYPGAAGTVVNNLSALKAGVIHAIGVIGDDGQGYDLKRELNRRSCQTDGLITSDDVMTPMYLKPLNNQVPGLAGEHERIDTKNRRPMKPELVHRALQHLDQLLPNLDAVIILDQVEEADCGVVTALAREELAKRARSNPKVFFYADSRRFITEFRDIIIKPNEFEAVGHANPLPGDQVDPDRLKVSLEKLRKQSGAPICVTQGSRGMLVTDPVLTPVPGVRVDGPIDTTGAGDSVSAGLMLALTSGATLPEAGLVGMLVASITIQQLGTTGTATPQEVLNRLSLWQQQNAGVEIR